MRYDFDKVQAIVKLYYDLEEKYGSPACECAVDLYHELPIDDYEGYFSALVAWYLS